MNLCHRGTNERLEYLLFNNPVYFFLYCLCIILCVGNIARHESFFSVYVPDKIRPFLLIFNFERVQISIFCIISQLFLYAALIVFVTLKIFPTICVCDDPKKLLTLMPCCTLLLRNTPKFRIRS